MGNEVKKKKTMPGEKMRWKERKREREWVSETERQYKKEKKYREKGPRQLFLLTNYYWSGPLDSFRYIIYMNKNVYSNDSVVIFE